MESRIRRPWPKGVDVDGNIVFDLDGDRLLANVDLHVPRALWSSDISRVWVDNAKARDIEFAADTCETKSFSIPIKIATNEKRDVLEISIGNAHENTNEIAVALSDDCLAFVDDGCLVGFLIRF